MKETNAQKQFKKETLNPLELTEFLLSCLNEREKDVLKRRHALSGSEKETLEAIGQKYNITRERVRQIERACLQKIKRLLDYKQILETLVGEIDVLVDRFGGIIAHHHLIDELLRQIDPKVSDVEKTRHASHLAFLLKNFVPEFFHIYNESESYHSGLTKNKEALQSANELMREIEAYLEKEGSPMTHEEIAKRLGRSIDSVYSHLHLSKATAMDPFCNWGHVRWPAVKPKRMSDRIYVILKKYGEPIHFKDIASYITKHYGKPTHPPTVHNELIADPRFVLVGRGIYALKEWGFETGTVKEVVERLLKNNKNPMTREEIINHVTQKRVVARSTILLSLNNSEHIKKVGKNRYQYI